MTLKPHHKKLIKEIESVEALIQQGDKLLNLTIQDLDLTAVDIDWPNIQLANTTFLGCSMTMEVETILREKGAFIYPKFVGYPYDPYRKSLYTWQELMEGYEQGNDQSLDFKIYTHFNNQRYSADINEAFAQRIHDYSIDDALYEIIGFDDTGMTKKKCVGIMGGHVADRDSEIYLNVAQLAQKLTKEGYFVLTGGGPGVMEAGNLGAYFGNKSEKDLLDAIEILKQSPKPEDTNYTLHAKEVLEKYPNGAESMAIPTWFYGHEPSNVFAAHIAKYFANSLREDVLLSISLFGVIYAPGSAGTMQEIFADVAQNYYQTHGYVSPMIFFNRKFWDADSAIYKLLHKFAKGTKLEEMMTITDEIDEIVTFIKEHPPKK